MAALSNTVGTYFVKRGEGPSRTRIQGAKFGETDGALKIISSGPHRSRKISIDLYLKLRFLNIPIHGLKRF